uniref:NADH-plastoquinone oxidoreductase subunit K n=1 Tax=Macrothelypteris torresiana TaxID=173909 RepID=A0A248RE37_9MONI|nr:NADH-plastoquinone oxidoreductase subunit K [Macrothelypteris torresiana]ASU95733.1 NADH-plastoquinone oxidoreductase subunit K [Macrothelypteris torresiana]QBA55947.1 NADH-plastoquinone oxidoreductase subunit K [Macrothelypteris torresiana]
MVSTSKYSVECGREGVEPRGVDIPSNSVEPPLPEWDVSNSIFLANISDFSNWSRLSSLWPLLYGTSCCFIEFASLIGSRFDFDRYGLVPRSSPRQADLVVTAGTVTMKMAPSLVRLYEQMPDPKYVIAMGARTITGGMFGTDSYSTVRGIDKLIPVDIYLPGCPPKPEAIIDAVTKLRKKIARGGFADRASRPTRTKYPNLNHRFRFVPSIHIGGYNQELTNCDKKLLSNTFQENFQKLEDRSEK